MSCDFRIGSLEALTLGQHSATCGGLRHCGSGDKTFLIYHEISKV